MDFNEFDSIFMEHYVKPMRIEFGLMAARRQTLRITDPEQAKWLDALCPVDDSWTSWL